MVELLKPFADDADTTSWLSYDDFLATFSGLTILHSGGPTPYRVHSHSSSFRRDFDTEILGSTHFYMITSPVKTQVHLRVSQHIPCPDAPSFTPIDLSWIVLERNTATGEIEIREVHEMQEGFS